MSDIYKSYTDLGWHLVLIRRGSKSPVHSGWNKKENCITDGSTLRSTGVGLAHAYSGTMALDVDDWGSAQTLLADAGIDLNALYTAPDAVVVTSGKTGHGKLLYKMPVYMPTLVTKQVIGFCDGRRRTIYEMRCATVAGLTVQDVLPPSIHPETQQPYQWGGSGSYEQLPEIPPALMRHWLQLLDPTPDPGARVTRTTPTVRNTLDTGKIESAIGAISPDVPYDAWISIGMALHHEFSQVGNPEKGFEMWVQWSSASLKFPGVYELRTHWNSFHDDGDVTLGTLFHYAHEFGWVPPQEDVSKLFQDVKLTHVPGVELTGLLIHPPEMNMNLWPEVIRERALQVSTQVGCDPLIPLFAGLGAICGAVNANTRLELSSGYESPPVLWLMIVGAPGEKKSPGSKPMMKILEKIEEEDREPFVLRNLIYKKEHKKFVKKRDEWLEGVPEDAIDAANGIAIPVFDLKEPTPTYPLRLSVQDTTSQQLVRLSSKHPNGLLCYLDEMNSWFASLLSTSGENKSTWVRGYEAGVYVMDRVGQTDNPIQIYCSNFAVSVFGNVQGEVLNKYKNDLSKDGFLQRFAIGVTNPCFDKPQQDIPTWLLNVPQWELLIRRIYALPVQTFKLSPEARDILRDFRKTIHIGKIDNSVLSRTGLYQETYSKAEGVLGRLCLIYHLMVAPDKTVVSRDTMSTCVRIMEEYIIPSLEYLHADTQGDKEGIKRGSFDSWLCDHIIQISSRHEKITKSEIRHSARRQLDNLSIIAISETIDIACTMLEKAGWLHRSKEGVRSTEWLINPMLRESFQVERLAILRAKQRRMDRASKIAGAARRLFPGYDPTTMDNEDSILTGVGVGGGGGDG